MTLNILFLKAFRLTTVKSEIIYNFFCSEDEKSLVNDDKTGGVGLGLLILRWCHNEKIQRNPW